MLKQCVRLCLKLDLIAGDDLFVDGSKVCTNATTAKTYDRARYEEMLAELDGRIEQLLEECERIDRQEEGAGSSVA